MAKSNGDKHLSSVYADDDEFTFQLQYAPFVWLDEKKSLKKRFGYLDRELSRSILVNQPINVLSTMHFDEEKTHGVHAIQYSPSGETLAVGFGNGDVHIMNVINDKCDAPILEKNGSITSIKFIQTNPEFFVTSTIAGKVFVADVNATDTKLFCADPKNPIYTMDVTCTGAWLATAGFDATLRIYDTRTTKLLISYGGNEKCHRMKIRCVTFHPDTPNIIATGGWDNCVKLWDVRVNDDKPLRNFNGPQIHGDAIDFRGQDMLTGSCTLLNGLSIWDIASGQLLQNVRLANVLSSMEGEYYTCVKYYKSSASGNVILAAGRGRCALDVIHVNEMKIFGSVRMKKHVKTFDSFNFVATGGLESIVKIVELPYSAESYNYY